MYSIRFQSSLISHVDRIEHVSLTMTTPMIETTVRHPRARQPRRAAHSRRLARRASGRFSGPKTILRASDSPGRRWRRASNDVLDEAAGQLDEYFARIRTSFDLPLDLRGTPFQVAAWEALAEIPYGETRTYAEQAARIGRPNAVRADRCRKRSQPDLDRAPVPPGRRERRRPAGVCGRARRQGGPARLRARARITDDRLTHPGLEAGQRGDHGSSAAISAWISDCSRARA